jgi:hypothetical protein
MEGDVGEIQSTKLQPYYSLGAAAIEDNLPFLPMVHSTSLPKQDEKVMY